MGLFFGPLGAYFCLDFGHDHSPDQDAKQEECHVIHNSELTGYDQLTTHES